MEETSHLLSQTMLKKVAELSFILFFNGSHLRDGLCPKCVPFVELIHLKLPVTFKNFATTSNFACVSSLGSGLFF